ncbi:AmmeMemoRadiSam system radical SAM enzyme [Candidatus Woesearchaeota archaeon]|nr:AmmeMemoRadiSam system radical SAM enzyme [Candidatus Woesearchaeota archaeon]
MREASFYTKDGDVAACHLCPRECRIPPGRRGACGTRENVDGTLYAITYGKPCSMAVDPIEKKPLYHFLPGSKAFSIATEGCNLFCKWCQNSDISHPGHEEPYAPYGEVEPEEVVRLCKREGCDVIAFTYTEPTIFYEYMLDIAKRAKEAGIRTVMISNGYINEEPLQELIPYLDGANIDLKAFTDKTYLKWTAARLQPVLDTLERLHEGGVHVEVTTLVVPGVNDDEEQLESMYGWVEEHLGQEQVVHISRFFPSHKLRDKGPTTHETLEKAKRIAKARVDHVYVGNVGVAEETTCPSCGEVLVERSFGGSTSRVNPDGTCSCGQRIPGVWS